MMSKAWDRRELTISPKLMGQTWGPTKMSSPLSCMHILSQLQLLQRLCVASFFRGPTSHSGIRGFVDSPEGMYSVAVSADRFSGNLLASYLLSFSETLHGTGLFFFCARTDGSGVLSSQWALEIFAQVCFEATWLPESLLGQICSLRSRFSFEVPCEITLLRAVICATSQAT